MNGFVTQNFNYGDRYLVQLLIALNRPQETIEPLQSLLKLTPDAERSTPRKHPIHCRSFHTSSTVSGL